MICIWCRKDYASLSREHIIPEALGGNEQVVLRDAVCASCNNGLATIDRALVKQFEILAFILGVRGKNRKKPAISSWAPISGAYIEGTKEMHLNAGPGVARSNNRSLPAARKSTGIYDARIDSDGRKVTFKQDFGNDPNFLRALYKIGLNLVARFYGTAVAVGPEYDHIRKFVLGEPKARPMTVAMEQLATGLPQNAFSSPILREGTPYPLFQVDILSVSFLLDLHPEQKSLETIRGAATLTGTPLYVFPFAPAGV